MNRMANLENTQYFNVKTAPEVRVKEVLDLVYNALYHVRRPDLHYQLQGCQKYNYESRTGRAGRRTSEGIH